MVKSNLVNMESMLKCAVSGKYAVPHININNLEWIKACLQAANDSYSPIILGVSEGAAKYMCGFKNVFNMVNSAIEYLNISVPVALHLDHGTYDGAIEALHEGFSSVMFDGSKMPFHLNLEKLGDVILEAKKFNASVEAEIGSFGGNEDGVSSIGELANIDECRKISLYHICCLAAGIGNIHGIYPKNWVGLDFKRLEEISLAVNHLPLVLHGGTGIPIEMIKKSISLGIAKINVNTECQIAFANSIRKYVEDGNDKNISKKGYDPRKLISSGSKAVYDVVIKKIKEFGSFNKAKI